MLIRKKKYRGKRGFSLIELMVAMLIFATSLLIIFGMFPVAFQSIGKGRNVLLATEVAQKEMEYVKSLPFASIVTESRPDTTITTWTNGSQATTLFRSNVNVTHPYQGDNRLKLVRVQVKSENADTSSSKRVTAVVTLETIRADI